MITGAHVMLFSKDADADRAFVRDALGMDHVDAGGGWLIFKLPPSELAFHPGDDGGTTEFYLMCERRRSGDRTPDGDGARLRADPRRALGSADADHPSWRRQVIDVPTKARDRARLRLRLIRLHVFTLLRALGAAEDVFFLDGAIWLAAAVGVRRRARLHARLRGL